MSAILVPSQFVSRLSQIWVRKQLTYFRLYDTSRSGVITNSALRQVFDERAEKHFPPERWSALEPIMRHSWRILSSAECERDERVDWSQFLQKRFHCVTEAQEVELRALSDMADALLAAGELSHGGGPKAEDGLALPDVTHLLGLYNVDDRDAQTSFKILDQNRDGVVSHFEFKQALSNFFLSAEKDESSMMFGHLAWDDIEAVEGEVSR